MKLGAFFTRIGVRNAATDEATTRVILTDDAPEWLQDVIREAACGDDWAFETAWDACLAIDDGAITDDDSIHEWADSYVDIYTRELAQWYADHCLGTIYSQAESDAEQCGSFEKSIDVNKQLMAIQYFAIRSIASTILQAFEASKTDDTSDDDEVVS